MLHSLIAALLLASHCAAAIPFTCTLGVLPRKEFRTLTIDERRLYLGTVRKMHDIPSGETTSFFDRMAKLHFDWKAIIHGNSQFLPWHRYFLAHVEQEAQRVSGKPVTLPFWDWSFDSQAPELAPIWGDGLEHVGRSGDLADGCVKTGAFANMVIRTPNDHCLKRKFDQGDKMSALSSPEVLAGLMGVDDFKAFSSELESVPHGRVHVGVGGDMAVMTSPADPVFFLHHAMVDKIWNDWQIAKQGRIDKISGFTKTVKTFNDPRADRLSKITADSELSIFSEIKVSDTFNTASLCYTYERVDLTKFEAARNVPTGLGEINNSGDAEPQAPTASDVHIVQLVQQQPAKVVPADNRQELMKLRTPAPLPSDWLAANGLNEAEVREHETKQANLIAELNNKKDYVSPVALWNRDRLLGRILELAQKASAAFTLQKADSAVKVELKVSSSFSKEVWQVAAGMKRKLKRALTDRE